MQLNNLGNYYWWLNEESLTVLNRGYLLKGETVENAVKRITTAAAKRLNREDLQPLFEEAIAKGWFSPSSPIWGNMGTTRGLPISCNGVYVPDSIAGITHKLGESIMQTKVGSGTSGYFGELRGRGAAVTDNGTSSGAVSFMKLFDVAMDTVSQGGIRKGAFAAYLDVDHPDIKEFLQIKDVGNPIQNLFYGVCVPDYWLQEMIDGDEEKRVIWAKILESRQQKGLPYLFFTDNVNKNKPQIYKELQANISHSNLCVSPNTKILTKDGYQVIGDLENETLDIWNGEEWSEVTIQKTGENQKLLRVKTSGGYELDCTEYHKFYVQKGYSRGTGRNKLEIVEKRANELNPGDKLIKFELPIIEHGEKELQFAYENGFYSGDGCLTPKGQRIYLYGDKKDLLSKFSSVENWIHQPNQNRIYGHSKSLKDKFFIPDSSYSIKSRLEWLAGYLDADGTVTNNNGSQSLQITCVEKEFLKEIQLMLQELGCDSKVCLMKIEGDYLLPKNDGSGDLQIYNCKEVYRLLINGNSLYKLSTLGLKCYRLKWETTKPNRECSQFIKIESVEELPNLSDTYCFNEPKRHLGMFNGILTGQCSEICLPDSEDESFVCCLSSLNLALYDEWKDTDLVKLAIYFLDAVMSEYIEKTKGQFGLKESHNFAKRHRALGLGTLGLHSYYQSKMIPFEDPLNVARNTKIFKDIQKKALEASKELAEIYGPAPIFEESKDPNIIKYRNTTVLSIPPTTSSSAIMGQTSPGIEPYSSNYYKAGLAKGNFIRKNKYLERLLEEKGKNTDEIWRDIMLNKGSVQHLDFLTQEEKDVFKTFKEINQQAIIDQAAARQKYIDQGQSLNINIPPGIPIKEVNRLILDGWKQGIKAFYYQRSQSVNKELLTNIVSCTSCEG